MLTKQVLVEEWDALQSEVAALRESTELLQSRIDADTAAIRDISGDYERARASLRAAEASNLRMAEALKLAVRLIEQWHNMGEIGLPEELQGEAWRTYERSAPEMAPIRAALAASPPKGAST